MHKYIKELSYSDEQKILFETYVALLLKWNKKFNLTAITDYNEVIVKHILDSLSIANYVQGDQVLDVGTGAGLPGLILAIIFPEKQFTLLDSNGKKIRFINQAVFELNLKNVKTEQTRVENFQSNIVFDCIITRAFADLQKMLDLTNHLKQDKTIYLAMKANFSNEVLLKSKKANKISLSVPHLNETRTLVVIK